MGALPLFFFTETWLKPCLPTLTVLGYTVLTSPFLCRPGRDSGYLPGSCIIMSNSMTIERSFVCEHLEKSCQLLNLVCCFINCHKGVKVCVVSVYHSPSMDFRAGLIELQSVVSELLLYCQHIVIAGDLNVDLLTSTSASTAYAEFLTDYHLIQHISEPTRITSSSATLIDHILATPCTVVHSVYQSVGFSDHMVQFVDVNLSVVCPRPTTIFVRSFRNCDWAAVRESLASVPWQVMSTFDEIEDMWYFFKTSLYDILDEYAPVKSVVSKFSRRPTLWMTPELLKAIKEKSKAKRRVAKTTSAVDTALYKTFKNKLKTAIHEAKLHYLTVLLKKSKSNPYLRSKLWKSVNDIIGKSKSHQDSIITTISLDTINEFFCDVAVSADHETADQYLSSASVSSGSFHFTMNHHDSVLHMLQHLDIRKSTGPDGISARFFERSCS